MRAPVARLLAALLLLASPASAQFATPAAGGGASALSSVAPNPDGTATLTKGDGSTSTTGMFSPSVRYALTMMTVSAGQQVVADSGRAGVMLFGGGDGVSVVLPTCGTPGAATFRLSLQATFTNFSLLRQDGTTLYSLATGNPGDGGTFVCGPSGWVLFSRGPAGAAGATGSAGATGATGPTGAAGIVPFYGTTGLLSGIKCWQGTATTTTGGAWTVSFTTAGFTAAPNVQSQAVSPSGLLAGLLFSTMTAPTASSVSGVVALAGIGGLGGSGAAVQVRACGS